MNKGLFTAIIRSTCNAGSCGCVPAARVNKYTGTIHGNVDTLVQDFGNSTGKPNAMNQSGNRFKKMVYDYDLISGKVNQVSYQPGQADAYYHRYLYDAENGLTDVYTARDSTILLLFPEKEAHYSYYKHGPLMRTVLGQLQVQGLDYAYTLQGWLKGINPVMGGTLTNGTDTTEAFPVTQDVYGFSLNYYNKDYRAIRFTPQTTSVISGLGTNAAPLYNGNKAAMAVNIPQLSATKVYNYHYDQLNRIVAMDMYNGLNPNAGTFTPVSDTSYKERVSYDPNGNILGYLRNGDAGNTMDSLNYKYYANTNQLSQVTDNVSATKYTTDIDNQNANNYTYDAIGNMISAASDTITNITWNVYGKIATITKNAKQIKYTYDASGNRIMKQTANDTTVYVRDATGNLMSVYTKPVGGNLAQTEMHLYGSSRLGMATQHIAPDTTVVLIGGFTNGIKSIFTRGEKLFELSNHLGNVLTTVMDRRIQVDGNSDGTVDSYKADIASANDYYPFGMLMPGRKYSIANTNYRFGFNGKELDKETSSTTTYDYGFRIYSPGLGKFLSVDPLTKSYPWLTPYQFSGNNPIRFIDLDGLEVANPSIFRTAWNAITGDFHLNRMNSYLTENKLSSDNVIELNNETSVVYQVQKNAATGTNQTIYSIFRKARQGRDCLFCGQSGKDDDIGLTENEFLNTTVLSAHIMDAPIGLGGASKIEAVINGSKNAYYSFRQTIGVARQGLRALGNWKNEITFGAPVATSSTADLIKKGFHLHFENLGGLELGLSTTEEGQLALKWLKVGKPELANDAVKLFSKAISNNSFRAELLSRLKSAAETLGDATKFWAKGSREAEMTTNSLNEVRNVITTIEKNYVPK